MRSKGSWIGLVLAACLAGTVGLAFPLPAAAHVSCAAAEWGVEGGGLTHTRSDCSAGHLNAYRYRVEWKRNYHGILEFPPAYSNGVLYTGQDDGMLTAQSVSGKLRWHRWFFKRADARTFRPNPIVQTPTVWQGRLYFSTKTDRAVWCVDAATGRTIWALHRGGGEAAPIVVPGANGPTVYSMQLDGVAWAIDAVTGRVRWHERVAKRSTAGFTYADGLLFGADYAGDVYALHRDGGIAWKTRFGGLSDYADIAYSHGHLILGSRRGGVYSVSAANGRLAWYRDLGWGSVYGHPAVSGGAIYTTSYVGQFWKLSQRTGRVLWSQRVNRAIGGPIVLGDHVYFAEMGDPARRGRIHAYQTQTMRSTWTFPDGKYTAVTPAGQRLVAVGFTTLYALDPHR